MPIETVFFWAHPRTGSHYVMDVLAQSYNALDLNELLSGWIDYPTQHAILNEWNPDLIQSLNGDYLPPESLRLVREDLPKIFDIARRHATAADQPYLFMKIFYVHIKGHAHLQRLIPQADHHIILIRDPLSIYVSMAIAKYLRKWHFIETTSIQPHLNATRFLEWFAWAFDGYCVVRRNLRQLGVEPLSMAYEDLTATEDEQSNSDAIVEVTRDIFRQASSVAPYVKRYWKQDKRQDIRDKIINWESFSGAVEASIGLCPTQLSFEESSNHHQLVRRFLTTEPTGAL